MEYLYMFFNSLVSATLFPMGSEALLIYNLNIELNVYYLLFIATFGNSLGSILNYWIGLKGESFLVSKRIIDEKRLFKSKYYFDKYGGYSLLLSWVPIVGDPLTLIAGVLKYNLKKFIVIVVLAKFSRYLFVTIGYFLIV